MISASFSSSGRSSRMVRSASRNGCGSSILATAAWMMLSLSPNARNSVPSATSGRLGELPARDVAAALLQQRDDRLEDRLSAIVRGQRSRALAHDDESRGQFHAPILSE